MLNKCLTWTPVGKHSFAKLFVVILFLAALDLRCGAWGSHCSGFSCCGAWALERRLSSCDSRALEHRLSSCGARA